MILVLKTIRKVTIRKVTLIVQTNNTNLKRKETNIKNKVIKKTNVLTVKL